MSVMAMAVEPDLVGGPFTRADLEQTPNDGRRYEAKAVGEETFKADTPFPVTIVPADLVR